MALLSGWPFVRAPPSPFQNISFLGQAGGPHLFLHSNSESQGLLGGGPPLPSNAVAVDFISAETSPDSCHPPLLPILDRRRDSMAIADSVGEGVLSKP